MLQGRPIPLPCAHSGCDNVRTADATGVTFTVQCCFPKKDQSLNHQVRSDCLLFAAEVFSAAVSLDMDTVALDTMELVKVFHFLSAVVGVLQGAPEVDAGGDHAGESALAQVLLQSCCSCTHVRGPARDRMAGFQALR